MKAQIPKVLGIGRMIFALLVLAVSCEQKLPEADTAAEEQPTVDGVGSEQPASGTETVTVTGAFSGSFIVSLARRLPFGIDSSPTLSIVGREGFEFVSGDLAEVYTSDDCSGTSLAGVTLTEAAASLDFEFEIPPASFNTDAAFRLKFVRGIDSICSDALTYRVVSDVSQMFTIVSPLPDGVVSRSFSVVLDCAIANRIPELASLVSSSFDVVVSSDTLASPASIACSDTRLSLPLSLKTEIPAGPIQLAFSLRDRDGTTQGVVAAGIDVSVSILTVVVGDYTAPVPVFVSPAAGSNVGVAMNLVMRCPESGAILKVTSTSLSANPGPMTCVATEERTLPLQWSVTPPQTVQLTATATDSAGNMGTVTRDYALINLTAPITVVDSAVHPLQLRITASHPIDPVSFSSPDLTLSSNVFSHMVSRGSDHQTFDLALWTSGGTSTVDLAANSLLTSTGATNAATTSASVSFALVGKGFAQIVTGLNFSSNSAASSCALTVAGQAYCWGNVGVYNLGSGTTAIKTAPVAVSPSADSTSRYIAIANGFQHSCALTAGGLAYCWGFGGLYELGDGTTAGRAVPFPVTQSGVRYAAVGLGEIHTCALAASGQAYCWGYSPYGELGSGITGSPRTLPFAVTQAGMLYTEIASGMNHVCALSAEGQAYCWGKGIEGQVGNGASNNVNTPALVTMPVGVRFSHIAAGTVHTCALSTAGQAYCWGRNEGYGRLGNTNVTNTNFNIPTAVSAGTNPGVPYVAITAGTNHTCALTAAGLAYCWGEASQNGTGLLRSAPSLVQAGTNTTSEPYVAISAGAAHTCALTAAGNTYCWGYNTYGPLGTGNTTTATAPVTTTITGLTATDPIRQLSLGGAHGCARAATGASYCWGDNNLGQLGLGSTGSARTLPLALSAGAITTGEVLTQMSAGGSHSCGLNSAGKAYCWGGGSSGQLGRGSFDASSSPVAVSGSYVFRSFATGTAHTCALTAAGAAYCWGESGDGQLGNNDTNTDQSTPSAVTMPASKVFTAIAAGAAHTCGLADTGEAYCWGDGTSGQLGDAGVLSHAVPTLVTMPGGRLFTAIRVGAAHSCALANNGAMYCWGKNSDGQLADGGAGSDLVVPTLVSGASVYKSLAAGAGHTCGLTESGAIACWGRGTSGQLGTNAGSAVSSSVPASVLKTNLAAGEIFTGIIAGGDSTCATTSLGRVYCWGKDSAGQLGNGDPQQNSFIPTLMHRSAS